MQWKEQRKQWSKESAAYQSLQSSLLWSQSCKHWGHAETGVGHWGNSAHLAASWTVAGDEE